MSTDWRISVRTDVSDGYLYDHQSSKYVFFNIWTDRKMIAYYYLRRYLHNNGVKWCKVAWRNNSAHTHSHKLYLWLRSTAAVSGAQRQRPHRILRVSEGPSILAWPTLNMVKNYRGRIWSEATKDCPDFLGFLRAHRDLDWPTIHMY